ncbi:tRNA Delta(2)-isopentenylpyrophosphate transferase [gut metagenome]|uniref:tRNA Delta(2)-isopentenylpyrophosphate transferase n=1 Tax=gut metagenome TaxID=749906 RepID=J9GL87_9ZZZZ
MPAMQTSQALMMVGPTASGKSALSLAIAARRRVEIISMDSALVYRGMDIGSAKPTPEERAVCPHHLIDIREIGESYSAAEFLTDTVRLVREIRARGAFPLIVGGTIAVR